MNGATLVRGRPSGRPVSAPANAPISYADTAVRQGAPSRIGGALREIVMKRLRRPASPPASSSVHGAAAAGDGIYFSDPERRR